MSILNSERPTRLVSLFYIVLILFALVLLARASIDLVREFHEQDVHNYYYVCSAKLDCERVER